LKPSLSPGILGDMRALIAIAVLLLPVTKLKLPMSQESENIATTIQTLAIDLDSWQGPPSLQF
jgi:hypothetical protein